MRIPITQIAELGLNKDLPPTLVPANAWTDVRNVRFSDGTIQRIDGHSKALPSVPIVPYGLFSAPYAGDNFWVYAGLAKVRAFVGETQADITRTTGGDYTTTIYDRWNSCIFNGIPLFCNGVDVPQMWNTPALTTPLAALTAWPATYRAKVLRPFKSYLMALNTDISGTPYRRMVKWSHSASTGLPTSWDQTNPTLDAGEVELAEGIDTLVDCLPLGDINVIYGETSTFLQRLSGGQEIFYFNKAFRTSGLLAQGCAVAFKPKHGPEMHFAITQDDIVIHDSSHLQSIVTRSLRRWIFRELSGSSFFMTHAIPLRREREIWVFLPTTGLQIDLILIWNWDSGTWTIRDAPQVSMAASALYSPTFTQDDWDSQVGDWDSDVGPWGSGARSDLAESILMAGLNGSGNIFIVDDSGTFDGTAITWYTEHDSLTVNGIGRDGNAAYDPATYKMVLEVKPYCDGAAGELLTIEVGFRNSTDDPVVYTHSAVFTQGTSEFVSIYGSGRYVALKFSSTGTLRLRGYELDLEPGGTL